MTAGRLLALASALALAACASHEEAPSRADGWSAWSPIVDGVRCRVKPPAAARQGDVVTFPVELDVIEDRLPADRHLLDADLRRRKFTLEVEASDGNVAVVHPYDPYAGMPPDPAVADDPSRDLLSAESRRFSVDFPLATQWWWTPPGTHLVSVRLDFQSSGRACWTGVMTTPRFALRIDRAEPREEVHLLPKLLRIVDGRVTYHRDDAEEVRIARRNGCFVGAKIEAEGGGDMTMSLRGIPAPDDVNPIDAIHHPSQRLATAYTIIVYETDEAPEHLKLPDPRSDDYRELWRRRLVPSPAAR